MPFAVFRRHQRKLLAIIAILAMTGFVLSDVAFRVFSGGSGGAGNTTVVQLYGKAVRRSDIQLMTIQRNNSNRFMAELIARLYSRQAGQFFGDLTTRSIVDAIILEHEADRLGMPSGPEVAREWLKQRYGAYMTRELFETILANQFSGPVSGEQLLTDISNQIRISNVRMLLGSPVVTPLDIFQAYRDQNERVGVRAVAFPVDEYVAKVAEPTAEEVQKYYDQYKGDLPDPSRPTPGFKIPRLIQVEVLSIDGAALANSLKDHLTEDELKAYYENRKSEFKVDTELPDQIFAGDDKNELTPPRVQPFAEVRPYLATSLAEKKAEDEISARFGRIKETEIEPFLDKYGSAVDELEESKKAGGAATASLPTPDRLEAAAKKEGLQYRVSKLLTRDDAQHEGAVSTAEVGLNRLSGGRKFVDEIFDPKSPLYEPIELISLAGERFLVRKLQDQQPRIPQLDEIRNEVVLAWKKEKARTLAQQAADQLAAKLKKEGGKITGEVVDGHPVITTDPVTRLQPGLPLPNRFFENGPPTPTEIAKLPLAGPALRDAYFSLTPGTVAVEPNEPLTVYYTLTLNQRIPASFASLYAPNGDYFRYRNEALNEAMRKHDEEWMAELRTQAGLKPGWIPQDEAKQAKNES